MQVFVLHVVCHSSARTLCTLLLLLKTPFFALLKSNVSQTWYEKYFHDFLALKLRKEGGLRALSKEFQPEFFGKVFLAQCPSPAVAERAWCGQGKVGFAGQSSEHELPRWHLLTGGFRDMSCSGHVSRVLGSSVLLPVLQLWEGWLGIAGCSYMDCRGQVFL